MFSRTNHPYIQLDDSYLQNTSNPDYDTSKQINDGIPLQDLSQSRPLQRHTYRALETPTANLGTPNLPSTPESPLKSPSRNGSRAPSDIYKPLPQVPLSRWSGWRFTVAAGFFSTIFVLICNIAMAGWSATKGRSNTNNLLLYRGDCGEMKRIDTLSHLAINILSTILLGASNYSMQVLVAPTRANIDEAHPQGRILDIGISGFGNWRFIGWKRRILWLCLTLSTIPLHLIYNSAIFSTTSAVNYDAWIVSQDFLSDAPFNISTAMAPYSNAIGQTSLDSLTTALKDLRSTAENASTVQNMTTSECILNYNQNYVPTYGSVLLITNATAKDLNNNSFVNVYEHDSASALSDLVWMCDHSYWSSLRPQCNPDATNWTFAYYESESTRDPVYVKAESCLATHMEPKCTIELIPSLLYTVIACNILKAISFAYLTFLQFDPLITVGQAIASFLEKPDPTTEGLGAHSARDIRGKWISDPQGGTYFSELNQDHIYKPERRRWFSGASPMRWSLTLLACFFYWLVGLICLVFIQFGTNVPSFRSQLSAGFGAILPTSLARLDPKSDDWNVQLLDNVLLANFPQIILSLVYVSYNGLFTCMLLSREWVSYAWSRKGLRVHWPRGAQRATYWLSLPYRYSLPLLVTSGLIHWLLSQSIFVAQVNIYSAGGTFLADQSVNAIGWSGLALLILLVLGGVMMLTAIGFGCLRYRSGIPIASSSSRSISAACHPLPGRYRESTERLQYGIVGELGDGKYRVGFSSGDVKPLVEGDHYE